MSKESDSTAPKLTQASLKIRPDYERLIPRLTEAEVEALELSIKKDGQLEEIVVNADGVVLDGHTRFNIMKRLGIGIKFRVKHFRSEYEEKNYIIKSAVARRNLTTLQKVRLAQHRLIEEKEKAQNRQKAGKRRTFVSFDTKVGGGAMGIVAREFGVKYATFARACYILAHANPEQISQIESGAATINGLYAIFVKQKGEPASRTPAGKSEHDMQGQREEKVPEVPKTIEESNAKSTIKPDETTESDTNPPIETETVCKGCNGHFTRGELKRVSKLLCKECREKIGIPW